MDRNKIADRLRFLRKEKKVTTEQMAKELGFSRATITNYENGHRIPDRKNMKLIADYFNTTVDDIFFTQQWVVLAYRTRQKDTNKLNEQKNTYYQ